MALIGLPDFSSTCRRSIIFLRQCSPRPLPGCTAESAREHRKRQSVDPEGAEVSVQDEMVLLAEACYAVVATLGSIIATVEHFADDDYRDRQAAAQTIVGFIDTDFVVCLVLFQNVLRKSSVAANYLQSTEMDTSTAVELVTALKDALSTPELFDEIWTTATALTQAHDIASPPQIRHRQCRPTPTSTLGHAETTKNRCFTR